jgi:hypothetical protein
VRFFVPTARRYKQGWPREKKTCRSDILRSSQDQGLYPCSFRHDSNLLTWLDREYTAIGDTLCCVVTRGESTANLQFREGLSQRCLCSQSEMRLPLFWDGKTFYTAREFRQHTPPYYAIRFDAIERCTEMPSSQSTRCCMSNGTVSRLTGHRTTIENNFVIIPIRDLGSMR